MGTRPAGWRGYLGHSPSNSAAGYLPPSPPVLRGVTTKSTRRLRQREQISWLAHSGTARSAP